MPNPLLSVRQKIQAVIPEIMELKFGCEVLIFGEKKRKVVSVETRSEAKYVHVERYTNEVFGPDEYTILGRPISLADVLRAIENQGIEVELSLYGENMLIGHYDKPDKRGYYNHIYWHLSVDLSQQDSTVFEFLDEILK